MLVLMVGQLQIKGRIVHPFRCQVEKESTVIFDDMVDEGADGHGRLDLHLVVLAVLSRIEEVDPDDSGHFGQFVLSQ